MARNKDVDQWFDRYDNPMKAVALRIRDLMLASDPRLDECIKWQAPTFTYKGNLASFFPRARQHASLMVHQGASIPGRHPRLEGSGAQARTLKLGSLDEVEAAAKELRALVVAWCDWRDAESPSVVGAHDVAARPRLSSQMKRRTSRERKVP